jgi:hypothetical protein
MATAATVPVTSGINTITVDSDIDLALGGGTTCHIWSITQPLIMDGIKYFYSLFPVTLQAGSCPIPDLDGIMITVCRWWDRFNTTSLTCKYRREKRKYFVFIGSGRDDRGKENCQSC